METQNWLFFAVVCLLSFSQRACADSGAYNITEVLNKYNSYDQFNQLLSRTGLAKVINDKGTATVLVVSDGAAGSLSGQSKDTMEAVLKLHVILDYLDRTKIKSWKTRSQTFTSLYQTTGDANNDNGYINVTKTSSDNNNQIMFGNGRRNAKLTVTLQKFVVEESPLSVIELGGLIQPEWVFNLKASPPKKAPTPSPSDAPAPSKRHRKEAPQSAESPDAESPPEPDADADSPDSPAPAPGGKNAAASSSSAAAAAFAVLVGLLAYAMAF